MSALFAIVVPFAQGDGGFVREAGQGATSCVGKNDTICFDYIVDHIGDYVTPTLEHLGIVLASVTVGFVVAFGLVVISHRRRWLIPAFTGITGVIYTIPSIALFLLLLPITGRGNSPRSSPSSSTRCRSSTATWSPGSPTSRPRARTLGGAWG